MMTIYTYRFRKTSWGIHIKIKGHIKDINVMQDNFVISCNNLYLSYSSRLFPNEEKYLLLGLQIVANHINLKQKKLIVLDEIIFNECDYQEEGLCNAIIGFCSTLFSIEIPMVSVRYDKINNVYKFDFHF